MRWTDTSHGKSGHYYSRHLTHGDEIRLIEIHTGHRYDPLQAKVQYQRLSHQPKYDALSYTWGSAFDKETVYSTRVPFGLRGEASVLTLDGNEVKITESLHQALIRIRKPDKSVLLWVDAVCIDQTHAEEKSWQIQKMQSIYRRASKVIMWLGPADGTSDLAISTLASGYRHYLRTSQYSRLGQIQSHEPAPTNHLEYRDQMTAASFGCFFGLTIQSSVPIPTYPIVAVADLLARAYWGRGWCWQEFAMARTSTIMCGDQILDDGDMCLQIFLETWDRLKEHSGIQPHGLDHRPWAMMEVRRSYQNMTWIRESGFVDDPVYETPKEWLPCKSWAHMNPGMTDVGKAWIYREAMHKLSLKALLEESSRSWLQTSKKYKEDQIYALLGLATDVEQLNIAVDYSLPWEKVYTQVATTYLARGDLWFLNHVQGCRPNRSCHLPSWVPDWSEGSRGVRVSRHWSPSGNHLGSIQKLVVPDINDVDKTQRLTLRGVMADEISWTSVERFALSVNQLATPYRSRLYQWIRDIAKQCPQHSTRDIWSVLICNSTSLPLPESYQTSFTDEEMRQLFDSAFESILLHDRCSDAKLQLIIETWLRCFMQATSWKCVFKTVKGRLGLGPVGIKKGDAVCAFVGNETAFVLRSVALTSEKTRYRLISECYVHGLMDGEGHTDVPVEDIRLE